MSSGSRNEALVEERVAHTWGEEMGSKRYWSFFWWRPGGRGGSRARCDELNCLGRGPSPHSSQPALSSPPPARASFPAPSRRVWQAVAPSPGYRLSRVRPAAAAPARPLLPR
ncbi:hypothetical protein NN561_009679 [Cricetulus griseus]